MVALFKKGEKMTSNKNVLQAKPGLLKKLCKAKLKNSYHGSNILFLS
jgi:hypothetical protein